MTVSSGGTLRVLSGGSLAIQGDPTFAYSLGGSAPAFDVEGVVTRTTSANPAVIGVAFVLHESRGFLFSRSAFLHYTIGWVLLAGGLLLLVIALLLFGAAGEEMLFRGYGLQVLLRALGAPVPFRTHRDVFEAIQHQGEIQSLYTGGTIFHAFLPEAIDGETCKKLVQRIAQTKLPYFSITPTFSVCMNHGYLRGRHHACPDCGDETEVYSRIVGYMRPVRTWNDGKQQEFRERTPYEKIN